MNGACLQCLRRAWLLGRVGLSLDFKARDLPRFWGLLKLPDKDLIASVGGRRRDELALEYRRWKPTRPGAQGSILTTCVHRHTYPPSLSRQPLAPRALSVRGGTNRLGEMVEREIVAIVGARRATDYGMETARELARGLAACGITIASTLGEGIAAAVHHGALEGGGQPLAVMTGGVERCSPVWCRYLYRRILQDGCAISELVDRSGTRPRRWWGPACSRTLALLPGLVIVVEAEDHPWELCCANLAQAHGTPLAAVPGRVSSPASRGTNSLLMEGAILVRGPQDALDALYGVGTHNARQHSHSAAPRVRLTPQLARVLTLVGNGHNTAAKLAARGEDPDEIAMALIELELAGLLVRGDGGRYLPSARVCAA